MQEIYAEPIKPELIKERLAEIRAAGVPVAGALSPQRTQEHYKTVVDAGVDLFVIRGTTVSAEHVSQDRRAAQPQEVHLRARCAGHRRRRGDLHRGAAPDAHRRGGRARRLRRRCRLDDAREPRHPRPDGDRGRRCRRRAPRLPRRVGRPLRARHRRRRTRHQRRHRQGDLGRRRRRHARHHPRPRRPRRPAAAGTGAPRRTTPSCPAATGWRSARSPRSSEMLFGPSSTADGRVNLIGALRRSMATTGYSDLKEFQRVEVVVAPYQRSARTPP